jgi:hypothetical protein
MTKDAAGLTTATTQNFSTTSATQQPQQDANDIAQASSSTCPSPPSRSPSSSPLRPSQSTPQKRGVNGDYDPQDGALQVIDLGPVVTEIDDPDDLSDPLSNPLDAALQEEEAWDHDLKRVKVNTKARDFRDLPASRLSAIPNHTHITCSLARRSTS